jgi:hypothetical protein
LKPIRYGPFKIIDKIGNNAFHLDLPPYMQMYAVVNVENLKLYEPPLIDDQGEHVQIPSIDDFSPDDPGDQILLKIQSAQNHFKSNGSIGLVIMNPTQLVWVQTRRREREISRSVQNDKQAKKRDADCTVRTDADVACPYDTWQN